jgi:hypothetical protein
VIDCAKAQRAAHTEQGRSEVFRIYFDAATRLNEGKPLYSLDNLNPHWYMAYVYSPMLAVALRPIAHLSWHAAETLWFYVCIVSLLGTSFLWTISTGRSFWDFPRNVLLCLLIFNATSTQLELEIGQADAFLLLLVAGIYVADSRRCYRVLAWLIIFGALMKTWMIALTVYLVYRKRWRDVAFVGAGYVVGLTILFSAVGWREFPMFLKVTRTFAVQTGLVAYSVPGFARLQFASNMFVTPLTVSPIVYWLFMGMGYGIIGFAILRMFCLPEAISPYRRRLELGLITLAVLLCMSLCHAEYFLIILPLIADLLLQDFPGTASGAGETVVVAIAYLVYTRPLPRSWPMSVRWQHFPFSLVVSGYFYVFVAIGVIGWLRTFRIARLESSGDARSGALLG